MHLPSWRWCPLIGCAIANRSTCGYSAVFAFYFANSLCQIAVANPPPLPSTTVATNGESIRVAALIIQNQTVVDETSRVQSATPSTTALEQTDAPIVLCTPDCKSKAEGDSGERVKAVYDFCGKLVWPVTVLLILAVIVLNGKVFQSLLNVLRRVKAGEFEFEFNNEGAMRARTSITEAYQEFRKTAQDAYVHYTRVHRIQDHFDRALATIRRAVEEAGLTWPTDSRATLHVPDVVLEEFVYQLLDYVPRGSGSGRRFSSRRGILGRAWRLERSFGAENALDQQGTVGAVLGDSEETRLVQEWGMTRNEAASWQQEPRRAFLCTIVREPSVAGSKGIAQGVIYMDSPTPGAFGNDLIAKSIAERAESEATIVHLGKALGEAAKDLREGGTFLEF